MKRVFSILRRKPGFVDMSVPLVAGVTGYRIKAAQNWDVSATTIFTSTAYGFMDTELQGTVVPTVDHRPDSIRIIFKPSKYTAGSALPDSAQFWIQLFYVIAGVEQSAVSATPPSALTLLGSATLPYNAMQAISGTAPNVATLALATQLDLPRQVENVTIENQGVADLLVAFDEGGPEFPVKAATSMATRHGTVSSIWVRGGSGSAVPFRMTYTNANPR